MPRMRLDMHPDNDDVPQPGDLLVGTTKLYRVTASRHVDSRQWSNRWALVLAVIGWLGWSDPLCQQRPPQTKDGEEHRPAPGGRIHYSVPYKRGETPADHFGPDH